MLSFRFLTLVFLGWATLAVSQPYLDRRRGRVIIGFRSVSEEQAKSYNDAGTFTYQDSNPGGDQIGPGVYMTAGPGEYEGDTDDWACVVEADEEAFGLLPKIIIPAELIGTAIHGDDAERYIRSLYLDWTPDMPLVRMSYLDNTKSRRDGTRVVQILLPFNLINDQPGGIDFKVECNYDGRKLAHLPRANVRSWANVLGQWDGWSDSQEQDHHVQGVNPLPVAESNHIPGEANGSSEAMEVDTSTEYMEVDEEPEFRPLETATTEQTTWSQLVQQTRERFGTTEQELRIDLNQGVQVHPSLYKLLQESFPLILAVLMQLENQRGSLSSCIPGIHDFTKRSTPETKPEGSSNKGRIKSLCNELLALGFTTPSQNDDCTHFDQLHFYMELADELYAGTWVALMVILNGEGQVIARNPGPGFKTWVKIDMRKIFHSETVAIRDIHGVNIAQIPDSIFGKDRWHLQGIKLRGRCAGSDRVLQVDKYSNTNEYISIKENETPPWAPGYAVWGGSIDYTDWHKGNATLPEIIENSTSKSSAHTGDEF